MINKIKNSPFIALFSLVDLLIKFCKYFGELYKYKSGIKPKLEMGLFDIIIRILTTVALYVLWDAYLKLKKEIEKQKKDLQGLNLIGIIRMREIIFSQVPEQLRLPYEDNKTFFDRTPQGVFDKYLKNEYEASKLVIMDKLDITPSEAKSMLDRYYKHDTTLTKS